MSALTIGHSGEEPTRTHSTDLRFLERQILRRSFWLIFGLLALGTLTLPASLFGKSAMLLFLAPLAAAAILMNAWAWGVWPRGQVPRLLGEVAFGLGTLFCYLFFITRTLPPSLIYARVFQLLALLSLLWALRPFLDIEKRARVINTAIGVGRFAFRKTLMILCPLVVLVLSGAWFGFLPHVLVAGQDEAYRFTVWPDAPPSLLALLVFATLHIYVLLAVAFLAWHIASRVWPSSSELNTKDTPRQHTGNWWRVATICSGVYIVFVCLNVLRYDLGWRSLVWPVGGLVAHAEDIGTIWAPYERSKS